MQYHRRKIWPEFTYLVERTNHNRDFRSIPAWSGQNADSD